MKKGYSLRSFINDIHLWLGIGSGIVLFLVCLTGTLYTFRAEVEMLLEPEKYTIDVSGEAETLSLATLVETVEKETGGKIVFLETTADKTHSYPVRVVSDDNDRRGTLYFLNPYSGKLLGTSEGPATVFFMFLFKMHRWLLMDQYGGKIIVGVCTIIFVVLILSGLVLWVPKKIKNWRQGLKIKWSANWKRVNHDLHNTLGFYSSILLLIMALTGLCWSFEWYKDGAGKVLGAEIFKGRGEKPLSVAPSISGRTLPYEYLLKKVDALLPYIGDKGISFPANSSTAMVVWKHKEHSFFNLAAADKVQLNPYTGEVLELSVFSEKPLNEQVAGLIRPIHTGEIFGLSSKIVYFICCLIATSFPVTGTLIWINKLKKKKKERKKHGTKKIEVQREQRVVVSSPSR